MEVQRCGHCREEKELAEFAPSYRGRPGTWCRACMRGRYQKKPRPPAMVVPEGHGYCTKCKQVRDLDEFYRMGDGSLRTPCKPCYREWHRARYAPKQGATDEPRACLNCGEMYQPRQRRASLYCSRQCSEESRRLSGRQRDQYLRRKYGISVADYDRLLAEQDGGCALCGVRPEDLTAGRYRTYLHVDHCHETGRVRGLLCPEHNLLLGRFGDSPGMFRRVLAYLEADAS